MSALRWFGAMCLIFLMPAVWSTSAPHGTLRRVGQPERQWPDLGGGRHSGWATLWADGSPSDSFWIRFRGCRQTPAGTLRITVYDTGPDLAAKPYTSTITEWRSSGSILYSYSTERNTYDYWGRIEILSPAGCRTWKWGQLSH